MFVMRAFGTTKFILWPLISGGQRLLDRACGTRRASRKNKEKADDCGHGRIDGDYHSVSARPIGQQHEETCQPDACRHLSDKRQLAAT